MIHTPPTERPIPGPEYLAATHFLDHEAPALRSFARDTVAGETDAVGKAVKLFYAVRDGWRYDPFSMTLNADEYVASRVFAANAAYCIPKAILLAASARAVGIHAAIGLSDVVNHLTTDKLKAWMGSTYFMHHGYAVLCLEDRWVKAAPAFNIELCDRFHVCPTEFDGRAAAVFQEYDARDRRHMEYVKDHGCWVVGSYPDLTANGPTDAGNGRLIPTTSVEQYAATLARWTGVSATDIPLILPKIVNFPLSDLGFMA